MTKEYSDYLAHHGVKGQKWGVRRYQNEDGTLKNPKQKSGSSTWKAKDAPYLSDEELNRRNSRLQRENQYRQLTESTKHKAMKWIASTASAVLVASAVGAAKGHMAGQYRQGLKNITTKAIGLIAKYKKTRLPSLFSIGLKG